jgi:hypothetical protein
MIRCNSLSKLSIKHFLEHIDPKEVGCKTLTSQSRRAAGMTSAGEATRASWIRITVVATLNGASPESWRKLETADSRQAGRKRQTAPGVEKNGVRTRPRR